MYGGINLRQWRNIVNPEKSFYVGKPANVPKEIIELHPLVSHRLIKVINDNSAQMNALMEIFTANKEEEDVLLVCNCPENICLETCNRKSFISLLVEIENLDIRYNEYLAIDHALAYGSIDCETDQQIEGGYLW